MAYRKVIAPGAIASLPSRTVRFGVARRNGMVEARS